MIENALLQLQTRPKSALIESSVSLKDKNWFNTGGSAEYFAEPKNAHEFQEALAFASKNNLPLTVIGHGANCLISDQGVPGLVLRPALKEAHIIESSDEILVQAGAGLSMDGLIEFCLDNGILGLEEFSGIPGSVGGSVFINLHYYQFLLGDFLESAQIIEKETGNVVTASRDWFSFGYNHSRLHEQNYFVVAATFRLKRGTPLEIAYARGRRVEIIRHRVSRYPSKNTCGSFFRNFYETEVTEVSNGKKMIYVAYYLDKLAVKGSLKVGDAVVSYQHANMLVNQGNATSSDIIALARTMQKMVYERYGIIPQPECRLLGFGEYPLL